MNRSIIIAGTALMFFLSSCAAMPALQPEPSAVPSATTTPQPTSLPTVTPTTPPTVSPYLGPERAFPEGGFALRLPLGLVGDPQSTHITLSNPEQSIIFFVMGSKTNPRGLNNKDLLESALLMFFTGNNDTYTASEPQPTTIAGVEGFTTDLAGVLLNEPIKGRAFITQKADGQFLFGFGFANLGKAPTLWQQNGAEQFQAMMESARFLVPGEASNQLPGIAQSECQSSPDPTYGYSEINPIKVGGGVQGGMFLAEAYFNSLAGPNGEPISFQYIGSSQNSLQVFEVTVNGEKITLFLDFNSPIDIQAPRGFTCNTAPILDSL